MPYTKPILKGKTIFATYSKNYILTPEEQEKRRRLLRLWAAPDADDPWTDQDTEDWQNITAKLLKAKNDPEHQTQSRPIAKFGYGSKLYYLTSNTQARELADEFVRLLRKI